MDTDEIIANGIKGSTAKGRGLYSPIPTIILAMTISLLVACGGGSGPPTSESVVARGVITQTGSIWVNGVKYETPDGGSYSDDDSTSTTASYQVGQVVSLRGTRNSDGISGTATEVEYEAEIEGAADSTTTINGVTILIDNNTNITRAPSIIAGALVFGQRYEVSGFWVSDLIIQATFIKHDDDLGPSGDGVDEVKGPVDAVDTTSITVRGVIYFFPNASASFSVGDIVEIHFNPNNLVADRIELEDGFFDNQGDGQEFEIEGTVNKDPGDLVIFCSTRPGTDFMIDLTCIDWDFVDSWEDGLESSADMVSGLRVEAEGHFNAAGLLIAKEIKGRGNRVRISAIASNVDGTGGPGTLDVFGGAIQVTTESGLTEIEDPISDGGGFEIRGIRTGATSMLALRIKSESVGTNDHELRAEVDLNGVDSSSPNIVTVMGISSIVNPNSQLEDEDMIIAPGGGTAEALIDIFLDSIDDDDNVTNGPRDEVEVRIDISVGDGSLGSPYAAVQVEIEREDD